MSVCFFSAKKLLKEKASAFRNSLEVVQRRLSLAFGLQCDHGGAPCAGEL